MRITRPLVWLVDRAQRIGDGLFDFWSSLRTRARLFIFLMGVSLAVMTASFARGDFSYKMSVESIRYLDQARPSDVWFAESGELIALGCSPVEIEIAKWRLSRLFLLGDHRIESATIVPSDLPGTSNNSISFFCGGSALPLGGDFLRFSISLDGNRIAWVAGGYLNVSHIAMLENAPLRVPIRPETSVQLLSFTGTDLITLLYENGKIDTVNLKTKKPGVAGAHIPKGRWLLSSHGATMSLSSLDTGQIASIEIIGADEIKNYQHPPVLNASAVASSGGERIAVGTNTGEVVLLFSGRTAGATSSVPLGPEGSVKSLAFYDENRILAVGEFEGVHLITTDLTSATCDKLANLRPGTRLIRLSSDHLAFISSALAVGDLKSRPKLTENGWVMLGFVSFVLTLIGALVAVLQDIRSGANERA